MKKILFIIATLALTTNIFAAKPTQRWSAEKAQAWAADKGWIVGCDYVTATAINQIEMWQAESFDPQTMERELALAKGLGFNTVRVFFSNLVYADDPKGFKERFSLFLDICEKNGIKALPTFWTNGGKCIDPKLGKQPEAIKGNHNSQWVMTPGADIVNNPEKWGPLEKMVKERVLRCGVYEISVSVCHHAHPLSLYFVSTLLLAYLLTLATRSRYRLI